jgi:PPOX class probable F420-dependent enzyme
MPRASEEFPIQDPVVQRLLSGANLARLAYIGLDRRPRVVPIWFAYEDGDFLIVTGPRAEKVRALQEDGAVALTIDSHDPPYDVLLVNGEAALEPTEGMASEYPKIVKRFLGDRAEAYLAGMRGRVKRQVLIRVRPLSWRVLDFRQRFPKSLR